MLPSFLRLTVERTLLHSWARHFYLPFRAAATFSSLPSTDHVSNKTSSLERNKLQKYLDSVAPSSELTAKDIEDHKPSKRSPPGTRQYEIEYEDLVKSLARSFTVQQLRDAHRIFDLELPRRRRKRELAISIIEREWNWPSLSDSVKQRKEKTEIITQKFPLDAREAFLLLGKDGSNLHILSRKHQVRTSFISDPLSLAVKGVRGSVEGLACYIRAFKTDVAETVVQLPTPRDMTLKLCQRISRLSGALVESQDEQTLRVTYHGKEPLTSHIAKALVVYGAYESPEFPTLLVCNGKDESSLRVGEASCRFSLYPFFPAHPLPWNVVNGTIYRLRGTAQFDKNETKHATSSSRDYLTMDTDGKIDNLQKALLSRVTDTSQGAISGFQASLGHVLLSVPSTASHILTSPVPEDSSALQLLRKVKELGGHHVFIPSIPRHLLGSKPCRRRIVHRLIYHAIPKHQQSPGNTEDVMSIESIKLELGHNFSTATEERMGDFVAETHDLPSEYEESLHINESGFWRGTQSLVDLMLPEKAMDLQLSATNFSETPESCWPNELLKYKEALHDLSTSSLDASRAHLPLIFSDGGITFALKSSTFIREISDPLPEVNGNIIPTQVINESILDLNSNQTYATCKIACLDPSEESWKRFLHACDLLTEYNT